MIDKSIITDEQFKTQLRAERANYLALVKRMTNCSFISVGENQNYSKVYMEGNLSSHSRLDRPKGKLPSNPMNTAISDLGMSLALLVI